MATHNHHYGHQLRAGGGDSYLFPNGAAANIVDLEMEDIQTGAVIFADDVTEEDTLPEYLNANFPADMNASTPSFDEKDTDADADKVIQHLSVAPADTVLN